MSKSSPQSKPKSQKFVKESEGASTTKVGFGRGKENNAQLVDSHNLTKIIQAAVQLVAVEINNK